MAQKFEIQTVDSAFGGRVPDHLWQTVGRATTPRGAYRVYEREYRWYHPQQNAWTGHVRVLRDGRPVQIEKCVWTSPVEYEVYPLD